MDLAKSDRFRQIFTLSGEGGIRTHGRLLQHLASTNSFELVLASFRGTHLGGHIK